MKRFNKVITAAIVAAITFTACDTDDAVLFETTTTVTESVNVTEEVTVETSGETTTDTSETSFVVSESEEQEDADVTTAVNETSAAATSTPKPTATPKPSGSRNTSSETSSSGSGSSSGENASSGNNDSSYAEPTGSTQAVSTETSHQHDYNYKTYLDPKTGTPYGECECGAYTTDTSLFNAPKPTDTPTPTPEPTSKPAVAAIVRVKFIVSGCNITENIGTAWEDGDAVDITVVREYVCEPLSGTEYHSNNVSDYEPYGKQVVPEDLYKDFYAKYPNGVVWGYGTGYENGYLVGPEVVGFVDD